MAADGMAPTYLSSIEHGEKSPTYDSLHRLANALDVTVAELVAGDEIRLRREIEDQIQRMRANRRVQVLQVIQTCLVLMSEQVVPGESRGLTEAALAQGMKKLRRASKRK